MPIGLSTAILGSAVIGGVGSAIASKSASKTQANAATQAAQVQADAANRAADTQLRMYGQTREDLSPYRAFGASALPGASALLGFGAPAAAPAGAAQAAAYGIPSAFTGGAPAGPNWNAYIAADPGIAQQFGTLSEGKKAAMGVTDLPSFAQWHWQNVGQNEAGRLNPLTGVRVGQTDVDPQYASYFAAPAGATAPAAASVDPGAAPVIDANGIQAALENTPGYQFTKAQGIKALTSNLSARGLSGVDPSTGLPLGALGKGLAKYVTGLADSTYGSQVDRYMKAIGVGADAAKATGTFSGNAAQGISNTITGGAQATASGITGAANANAAGTVGLANAIGGIAQSVPNALITDKVLGMYAK